MAGDGEAEGKNRGYEYIDESLTAIRWEDTAVLIQRVAAAAGFYHNGFDY